MIDSFNNFITGLQNDTTNVCLFVFIFLGYIVAVDSVSPTVFCISETGDLLKWFDCSDFMREPTDIAIHDQEYYVCDFKVVVQAFHQCTINPFLDNI